jgi:hypothetical protein
MGSACKTSGHSLTSAPVVRKELAAKAVTTFDVELARKLFDAARRFALELAQRGPASAAGRTMIGKMRGARSPATTRKLQRGGSARALL